jgi:hypothetical protein
LLLLFFPPLQGFLLWLFKDIYNKTNSYKCWGDCCQSLSHSCKHCLLRVINLEVIRIAFAAVQHMFF